RDRRQRAIQVGPGRGRLAEMRRDLLHAGRQRRLMATDLLENRRRLPDEDAAVPKIAAVFQIPGGRGGIRLLYKPRDRMAGQLPGRREPFLAVRLDVTVAGLRADRLDAERHEV